MGILSGRLGLKKLAFLQERDDWLSAASAKRELRPGESGDDLLVSALDLLFAVVAFMDEHDAYVRGLTSSFLIRTA